MARLIRKTTTHYLDAAGKRVSSTTPGARRVSVESRKWYGAGVPGWPPGKAVPLATDRRTAERMLAELVRKSELGAAGLRSTPASSIQLDQLVNEFAEVLARKTGQGHVAEVAHNVRRVLDGCRLSTLADLLAPDVASRVEAFVWKLPGTPRTRNGVGKHARQFTRWLWRRKRELDHDPLAGMDLPGVGSTRKRAPFTAAELERIVSGIDTLTRSDPRVPIPPPQRATIYLLAATTGLRAAEIGVLTPAHFALDANPPTVHIEGEHTKNGQPATLPIAGQLANRLRPLMTGTGRLWPGKWWRRAAEMLWRDMKALAIPVHIPTGRRDFHSLRHTFITMLGQGTASAKAVQNLARHSTPVLTVGRYSHADLAEQHAAVSALPVAGPDHPPDKDRLLATLCTLFAFLFAPPTQTVANGSEQLWTDSPAPEPPKKRRKRKES